MSTNVSFIHFSMPPSHTSTTPPKIKTEIGFKKNGPISILHVEPVYLTQLDRDSPGTLNTTPKFCAAGLSQKAREVLETVVLLTSTKQP